MNKWRMMMNRIKNTCAVCAKIAKIIEIMMYPYLIAFIVSFIMFIVQGESLITSPVKYFGGIYGLIVNYLITNIRVKIAYGTLILVVVFMIVAQIILMNRLHKLLKSISEEGNIFLFGEIKNVRDIAIVSSMYIFVNASTMVGLFLSFFMWIIYQIYKYQCEIQHLPLD